MTLAVLDVGKTHTKLSLVDADGRVGETRARANAIRRVGKVRRLDADAIESWLVATLAEFAATADIEAIVPVAHGAAAALIVDDRLAAPVLDYESKLPAAIAAAYQALRDPFERTLSPLLPMGLNLGAQLFWQETLCGALWPARAGVLPWPQYWAWRLCGVKASEVTSLGCHTDLWYPREKDYSDLAKNRGWDGRFAPLMPAGAVLGRVRPEIAQATGLSGACEIHCGIHDSNAALVAARAMRAVQGKAFTLVSTGTWFIALQSGAAGLPPLDPARDTLANVDVEGRPIPSSRFMGGREYAAIQRGRLGAVPNIDDASRLVARGVLTRPSFVDGSGPFPAAKGAIDGAAQSRREKAALASLHLALMQDVCLDLIAAEGPVLIEGRFADDPLFAPALAALRPGQPVLVCSLGDGIALGAARLRHPELLSDATMPVAPLDLDLTSI